MGRRDVGVLLWLLLSACCWSFSVPAFFSCCHFTGFSSTHFFLPFVLDAFLPPSLSRANTARRGQPEPLQQHERHPRGPSLPPPLLHPTQAPPCHWCQYGRSPYLGLALISPSGAAAVSSSSAPPQAAAIPKATCLLIPCSGAPYFFACLSSMPLIRPPPVNPPSFFLVITIPPFPPSSF